MKVTGIVCTAAMIILGIYDLIVVIEHGVGCSISRFMQESMFASPLVNGAIFFILGHWLGYMPPKWYQSELLISHLVKPLIETGVVFEKDGKYHWTKTGNKIEGQDRV